MMLEISPLDSLFFRDGRAFTMGQDNLARSRIWPPISTIVGALRAQYFRANPNEFEHVDTENDKTLGMMVRGIYFQHGDKTFCPMPRDLVTDAHKGHIPQIHKVPDDVTWSSEYRYYLRSEIKSKGIDAEKGLISVSDLVSYLKGSSTQFEVVNLDDLICKEHKVGIAIDKDFRTAKDKHLYSIEMINYKSDRGRLSILVDLDLADSQIEGSEFDGQIIKLGGEGRLAEAKVINIGRDIKKLKALAPPPDDEIVKIYNLTPLPKEVLSEIEVVMSVTGRSGWVGGFDMVKRQPKPMKYLIPRGSVHYVKNTEQLHKLYNNPGKWGDLELGTLFLGRIGDIHE